jgi:hypothetical protein
MSVETGFDAEGRFAWLRYGRTEPTPQEVMSALRAVCLDTRLRPGGGILIDRRSLPPPVTSRVRQMVGMLAEQVDFMRGRRMAFVIDDHATYGMVRMGQLLGADLPIDTRIFADVPAAEAWLSERAEIA